MSTQNEQIQELVHKHGKSEIKEARKQDISVFTVRGTNTPTLLNILEKLILRASRDVGLDLRGMKEISTDVGHTLRRIHKKLKVKRRTLLLYSPQARILEILELTGGSSYFSIYNEENGTLSKEHSSEKTDQKFTATSMTVENEEITSDKIVHLTQDMQQTRRIQQSLDTVGKRHDHLIHQALPDISPVELFRHCAPCETIGGDFYLYQQLDENHLGIAIGDVSGHGIEAALLMSMTRKVLELRAKDLFKQGAAAIVKQANKDIFPELDRYSFVTGFYGILNLENGHFQYARAGHNYPLLYSPLSKTLHQLSGSGIAFGLDNGTLFDSATRDHEVYLKDGDHLVIYTDGVTEANNPQRGLYGIERLGEFMRCAPAKQSATSLGKAILESVDELSLEQPLEDDLTLLCIRFHERTSSPLEN